MLPRSICAAAAEALLAQAVTVCCRRHGWQSSWLLLGVKLEIARLREGRGGADARWIKCTPEFVVMRTHLQLSRTKQKPFILARVCV